MSAPVKKVVKAAPAPGAKPGAKRPASKPGAKPPASKPGAAKPSGIPKPRPASKAGAAQPGAKQPAAKPGAKRPASKPGVVKRPVSKAGAKRPVKKLGAPVVRKAAPAKSPAMAVKRIPTLKPNLAVGKKEAKPIETKIAKIARPRPTSAATEAKKAAGAQKAEEKKQEVLFDDADMVTVLHLLEFGDKANDAAVATIAKSLQAMEEKRRKEQQRKRKDLDTLLSERIKRNKEEREQQAQRALAKKETEMKKPSASSAASSKATEAKASGTSTSAAAAGSTHLEPTDKLAEVKTKLTHGVVMTKLPSGGGFLAGKPKDTVVTLILEKSSFPAIKWQSKKDPGAALLHLTPFKWELVQGAKSGSFKKKAFQKIASENRGRAFSVSDGARSLDLVCKSAQDYDDWISVLKSLQPKKVV